MPTSPETEKALFKRIFIRYTRAAQVVKSRSAVVSSSFFFSFLFLLDSVSFSLARGSDRNVSLWPQPATRKYFLTPILALKYGIVLLPRSILNRSRLLAYESCQNPVLSNLLKAPVFVLSNKQLQSLIAAAFTTYFCYLFIYYSPIHPHAFMTLFIDAKTHPETPQETLQFGLGKNTAFTENSNPPV